MPHSPRVPSASTWGRRPSRTRNGPPHVIAEFGDAIAVGLDVRGTTLAARGWTQEGGDLWAVMDRLEAAGCARYVVTDVTKDGTLQGPNVDLLRQVMERTPQPGHRIRRRRRPRRHRGAARTRAAGSRGRDRRQGAVRGRVHAARGPGRRGPMTRRLGAAATAPACPGRGARSTRIPTPTMTAPRRRG